jgi:ApaG protein
MPKLCTTQGVTVEAASIYLDEYSKPSKHEYLFCYRITISNNSENPVKLLNRHWLIIDSKSKKSEVKGAGVVGEQPELAPGKNHSYLSFCSLETDFGTMEGSYEMLNLDSKELFEIQIPRFYLSTNLNEFAANKYRKSSIVRHKENDSQGIVMDYDMYFLNDEQLYMSDPSKPRKDQPWYYILIDKTNALSYTPESSLELALDQKAEITHPLIGFFFDPAGTQDNSSYKRNNKTWEDLKLGRQ